MKSPVCLSNISDGGIDKFRLQITNIVKEVKFAAENPNHEIYYGTDTSKKSIDEPPFHIGYQTPNTICFTRNSNDHLELT